MATASITTFGFCADAPVSKKITDLSFILNLENDSIKWLESFSSSDEEELVTQTKKLIEYEVFNPENQFSAFTGQIILYTLEPDEVSGTTMASSIRNNTDLDSFKRIQHIEQFKSLNTIQLAALINKFIKKYESVSEDFKII